MNEALARDLYLKYPKILKSEDGLGISLDVGDGWYDLIDILCSQIQHHIDWKNGEGNFSDTKTPRKPEEKIHQLVAEQIKEKFGSLRFYACGGDERIAGMIDIIESLSSRTCEVCGMPGKSTDGGWIRTLCKKHAIEQGREFEDGSEDQTG